MQDYVSLAIVGAAVSLFVQFVKNSLNFGRSATLATVVAASLGAGGVYYAFNDTALWQTFLEVLLFANAVYGFIISSFEA